MELSNNKSNLIIFDCDGVLRSASWEGLFRAHIAMITALNIDYRKHFTNMEEFKRWWNPDWHRNNEKLGVGHSEAGSKAFYDCYHSYISLFSWLDDILGELSKNSLLGILSASSEQSVKKLLGEKQKYFDIIVGHEKTAKLKPDPEGINLILKESGFSGTNALMIGDLDVDIKAGKNAGIKTGAVSWGLGDINEISKLKPDYIFLKPEDLLSI